MERVRRARAAVPLVAALMAGGAGLAGACNPATPLELADWTLPVPEGVTVHEYAPVPPEERQATIEAVPDLVIGDEADPDRRFYQVFDVAVDPAGNIYVFEAGNRRIQVFDEQGTWLRTFGGPGQGPGELGSAGGHLAVGRDLVVHKGRWGQLTTWDLEGGFLDRFSGGGDGPIWEIAATESNDLLGIFNVVDEELRRGRGIGRVGEGGPTVFAELGPPEYPEVRRETATTVSVARVLMPTPVPRMAASRAGDLYFTHGAEYQVHSTTADGEWRWALRVAQPRLPVSEAEIEAALAEVRERVPDATRREVDWPSHHPALSVSANSWQLSAHGLPLRADGRGNLYVFHYLHEPFPVSRNAERDPHVVRDVDVYSPDGQRIFAGRMPEISWHDALDEHVYGVELDPATDEQRVVRYRLVTPF